MCRNCVCDTGKKATKVLTTLFSFLFLFFSIDRIVSLHAVIHTYSDMYEYIVVGRMWTKRADLAKFCHTIFYFRRFSLAEFHFSLFFLHRYVTVHRYSRNEPNSYISYTFSGSESNMKIDNIRRTKIDKNQVERVKGKEKFWPSEIQATVRISSDRNKTNDDDAWTAIIIPVYRTQYYYFFLTSTANVLSNQFHIFIELSLCCKYFRDGPETNAEDVISISF